MTQRKAAAVGLLLVSCALPMLDACASTPAPARGPDSCITFFMEATAALANVADTNAANVAAAQGLHAAKMAEYHACLSRD